MVRSPAPVLMEMHEALSHILAATQGKTLSEYQQDWLLRLASQRALEIISEAARHLPEDLLATQPHIPWPQIRGIGNILRHEYHKVADAIIWAVITDHLPVLLQAVTAMQAHHSHKF